MSVRDFLSTVRANWWIIVATALFGAVTAGTISYVSAPVYQASSSLYFSMNTGGSATDLNQGQTYTQNQMVSFAQLAVLPVVLSPVIEELELDTTAARLAGSVSVTIPQNSVILDITVASSSAENATDIANVVAKNLVDVVADVAPRSLLDDKTSVVSRIVKEAQVPRYASAPNTKRNTVAGFAAGLLVGMLIAYFRRNLDTRVRKLDDVASILGVPAFGTVMRHENRQPGVLFSNDDASGAAVESYRRVRTNLEILKHSGEPLCIVLSSAHRRERKGASCANLAAALAETGDKVLVIDADLRRPRLANDFGLRESRGLASVLEGREEEETAIQHWAGTLYVMTAGRASSNPGKLLVSEGMKKLMYSVRARYDIVLVNAPAVLPVADAVILSKLATGLVLLADARGVRAPDLNEASALVNAAGSKLLGVVIDNS